MNKAFGLQSLMDFGIGVWACNVISDSDKCHENNNSQRERVSWEERERLVRLGEQGSLLCEDYLSDKI